MPTYLYKSGKNLEIEVKNFTVLFTGNFSAKQAEQGWALVTLTKLNTTPRAPLFKQIQK